MTTYADSSRTGLSWVEETTWDTTPATPEFTYVRFTGESLSYNISNETSNEIRNDSNITDLIQIGAESSGGFTFEASYENPPDALMCAALRSTDFGYDLNDSFSGLTNIQVATTSTYVSAVVSFATAGVQAGDWIRVSGFAIAANNGFKLVTNVATTTLTVAQTLVVEAASQAITMYGSTVRNSTTDRFFSLMREHGDTADFFKWSGMMVNNFGIDVAANQIITGSYDFMGGAAVAATVTYDNSGTPTAAPTGEVYSSVSDVATIYIDTTESTLEFMNVGFAVNNNLRGKPAIGTLGNIGVGTGVFDVTGSFSTYFEDQTLYTKFVNGTEFALYFGLHTNTTTPGSSDTYIFSFPRCKIETDSGPQAGSQNQDLMEDIAYRAIYDSTALCTMSISKIKADATVASSESPSPSLSLSPSASESVSESSSESASPSDSV